MIIDEAKNLVDLLYKGLMVLLCRYYNEPVACSGITTFWLCKFYVGGGGKSPSASPGIVSLPCLHFKFSKSLVLTVYLPDVVYELCYLFH